MARRDAKVVDRTAALLAAVEQGKRALVTTVAETYLGLVRQGMMASPASGREYRRVRTGGVRRRARGMALRAQDFILHRASAPGEAPAVDQGTLLGSVTYALEETGTLVEAVMGSSLAKIPAALEFGRTDGTIAPRPVWRPKWAELVTRLPDLTAQVFGRIQGIGTRTGQT